MGEFRFKQFAVDDAGCAMKVGTDSVLLGAWADVTGVHSVLDLGAGSGLLALMMAQRCPDAGITAVEIDPQAAEAARRNFDASLWTDRLVSVCADALAYSPDGTYDLIVCNPPYFTSDLRSPDPRRAAARHASGSLSPETAIEVASRLLSPNGSLAMVTPAEYSDAMMWHAALMHMDVVRMCLVSTIAGRKPARVLWQMARAGTSFSPETLAIRNPDNTYTDEYTALTSPYYLHLTTPQNSNP